MASWLVPSILSVIALAAAGYAVMRLSRPPVKKRPREDGKSTMERMLWDARAHNERLERLQRDKDSLIQVLVHDLRSPLTTIMFSLEHLRRRSSALAAEPDSMQTIEDAYTTAERLAGMLSEILDTARLEEGRITINRTAIPARDLVERVQHQLGPLARAKKIDLGVQATQDLMLEGDPRLVMRLLENLLSNSIRHAPSGGKVMVNAVREAGDCRLSVHNNGPPIDAADRTRLFNKFEQGRDGLRFGGWGLGLYFCRMVVEAHGGAISIEDVDGWPASFVVRLPAQPLGVS